MKKGNTYLKVVAVEGSESAEMLLYGYVGQASWWMDNDEEALTDIAVMRKLRELEGKYKRINVRINSPGGSVMHGEAILNALRNSTAEVHAYNDGLAASMAADIWMACKNRHMAKNAKLMIHNVVGGAWGNAKQMRTAADILDKFDTAAILSMSEYTGMTEEEIREKFYDYEDHWMTYDEVKEMGMLTNEEEYTSKEDMIDDPEKMSYADIVRHFARNGDLQAEGWLKELKRKVVDLFRTAETEDFTKNKYYDMKIDDFNKSLDDNTLDIQAVIADLEKRGYKVNKTNDGPEEEEEVVVATEEFEKLKKENEDFRKEIEAIRQEMKALGAKPGTPGPIAPESENDADDGLVKGDDGKAYLEKRSQEMAKQAKEFKNPFVG